MCEDCELKKNIKSLFDGEKINETENRSVLHTALRDFNLNSEIGKELLSDRQKIEKFTNESHFMLRRGIFFSHRDLNRLLDDYEKGKKFFLYTGRGPSGHTHIGHLVPWVFAKWLQEKFGTKMYFQLTDDEKFWTKREMTLEKTSQFALENALDFIALGFKSENTKIIIDTKI